MIHENYQSATVTDNNTIVAQVSNGIVSIIPLHNITKYFSSVLKKKDFYGQNFKRWQERVFSALNMYGVATTLIDSKPDESATHQLNQ